MNLSDCIFLKLLLTYKISSIFRFGLTIESSGTRSHSERIYSMGICNSKPNVLAHLDDSVKVMVRHDAKALERKGQTAGGFVPRAPHPMIDAAQNTAKPTEAQEE